jgi:hypothetical protein
MRPFFLLRPNSVNSNTSAQLPVNARGTPPASRLDWLGQRRPRRCPGPGSVYLLLLLIAFGAAGSVLQPITVQASPERDMDRRFLLPDNQIVTGTVQHVTSGVIQVNVGEPEPLFLSAKTAGDKRIWPVKPGDKLTIILSNENKPVDFHRADEPGWDLAVKGRLLQPLVSDRGWAVLQTDRGTNLPYKVAEDAQHKVQNIPVGVPALFLFDGQGVIVDATYGTQPAMQGTLFRWEEDRKKRGNP